LSDQIEVCFLFLITFSLISQYLKPKLDKNKVKNQNIKN
jgi:hypothetical protein